MLKEKALEVRDALLESLVSKAREQNQDIISRYEAILSRIAEKPANEADLAALRGFIVDSKEKVRCYWRAKKQCKALLPFSFPMDSGDTKVHGCRSMCGGYSTL